MVTFDTSDIKRVSIKGTNDYHNRLTVVDQAFPIKRKMPWFSVLEKQSWLGVEMLQKIKVFSPIQYHENRKNDLILIMTPEKQDKTLELSKHWPPDSTPARNEVIMKTTYPVNQ